MLIDPPLAASRLAAVENRNALDACKTNIGGRSLAELRRVARDELLAAALRHTRQYASPSWLPDSAGAAAQIYLVGHQPELFHPGVWLKNFVLDQLAKRATTDGDSAVAVHVLIDNDIVGDVSISTPTGSMTEPDVEHVALDRSQPAMPWEERGICDLDFFQTAGERITRSAGSFVAHPLAEQLWSDVNVDEEPTTRLGTTLARMRHRMELAWGLKTLEVPLSELCQTQAYRWLVAFLLTHLQQVHASCNTALAEYRQLHRLRSPSHPMPDLAEKDGRWEAPLWIWTRDHSTRRPLYVEQRGTGLRLSDGASWTSDLPTADGDDLAPLVDGLEQLAASGVRIRPRALATTMFLRVFLSDYFIHGIGGAKYDQVTDCIIQDLFVVAPPAFATVSGTRLLPVEMPTADAKALRAVDRQLRDWEFNPQRLINDDLPERIRNELEDLTARKRTLMQHRTTSDEVGTRHAKLQQLNTQMQALLRSRRDALWQQREQIERGLQAKEILGARDFSFCLYPESTLRPWLLGAVAEAT